MRPHSATARRPAIVTRNPSVTRATPAWSSWLAPKHARTSVAAHPTPLDAAQVLGKAAIDKGSQAAKSGVASGLRFIQFLRAYIRAFAAGLGSFLLLSEIASGHWNIFAMVTTHLLMFVAAPFYALALAPSIFAMYRALAAFGLQPRIRAYVLGLTLGTLMIVPRVLQGKFLLEGNIQSDLVSLSALAGGAIAAYAFNREVEKLERRAEVA